MGLFNRNKLKNTSEQSSSSTSTGWDKLRNVPYNNGRNDAITLQKNPNANNYSQQEYYEAVIDQDTGQEIYVTHEQTQQNKIINYLLHKSQNKNKPTTRDEEDFYGKLNSGEISQEDETHFINSILGPTENIFGNTQRFNDRGKLEKVFSSVISNPQTGKIFQEAINNHDQLYSAQLSNLLTKYPTPKDFEKTGKEIVVNAYMKDKNSLESTAKAVEDFKKLIYGKKYEYQKALDELHKKAEEYAKNNVKTRSFDNFGQNNIYSNTYNIPESYQDNESYSGVGEQKEALKNPEIAAQSLSVRDKYNWFAQYGKQMYSGSGERPISDPNSLHAVNEDTEYVNEDKKIYAMFDGAGGSANGAAASQTCANVLEYFLHTYPFTEENYPILRNDDANETPATKYLRHAASVIQNAMENDQSLRGSYSTGLITKLSEDNRRLDFVNIGDSQLWLVRDGKVTQVSKDQGYENKIESALGTSSSGRGIYNLQPNIGSIELEENDVVLLCSDGIMGDYDYQKIDPSIITEAVASANNPQEIADRLVWESKKSDDTSVIALKF